jgi:hypothetical protein
MFKGGQVGKKTFLPHLEPKKRKICGVRGWCAFQRQTSPNTTSPPIFWAAVRPWTPEEWVIERLTGKEERMDYSKAFWVICITLILVIGLNASIYVAFTRRKNEISQVDLFRQAANRARAPWHEEDKDLEELSKIVAELKKKDE